jgi:hypothetical protein
MKMSGMKMLLFALALALPPAAAGAQETREGALDVRVIIDGSAALKSAGREALDWLSEELVNRLLLDGDRLSVWIAGARAELVFSGALRGPEEREALRERLGTLGFSADTADFAGALREAAAQGGGGDGFRPYTLLITGARGAIAAGSTVGQALRYSRVKEFSGWRVLQAAPEIGGRVREAAAAYLGPGN